MRCIAIKSSSQCHWPCIEGNQIAYSTITAWVLIPMNRTPRADKCAAAALPWPPRPITITITSLRLLNRALVSGINFGPPKKIEKYALIRTMRSHAAATACILRAAALICTNRAPPPRAQAAARAGSPHTLHFAWKNLKIVKGWWGGVYNIL